VGQSNLTKKAAPPPHRDGKSLYFTDHPLKIAPSSGGSGPCLIHGSLGPPHSSAETASWSVQPFLQGSIATVAYRPTDRARYSVCNNRPHLHSSAMRPNIRQFGGAPSPSFFPSSSSLIPPHPRPSFPPVNWVVWLTAGTPTHGHRETTTRWLKMATFSFSE